VFAIAAYALLLLQALVDIVSKIQLALPPDKTGKRIFGGSLLGTGSRVKEGSALTASEGGVTRNRDSKPFDGMNNIVANLLLNLTRYINIKFEKCTFNRVKLMINSIHLICTNFP
jgi:hypothetical protein